MRRGTSNHSNASGGGGHGGKGGGARDGHVRVAVRVRPLLPDEVAQECTACVSHPKPNVVNVGATHMFTYDYAFPLETTQVSAAAVTLQ